MQKIAIYAGTFDPLTLGHLDLIERAAEIFDSLVLAIAVNVSKNTLFTVQERVEMAKDVIKTIKHNNVTVESFDGLLVDYAKQKGINIVVRGIRAYSDFEYEFQMALTNRKLSPSIETLFMMPKETHSYVSSRAVKEIARLGGNLTGFVPAQVIPILEEKVK